MLDMNANNIAQEQLSVMKNLRNLPAVELPKIPLCDFNSIFKQVQRKRQKIKDFEKWNNFVRSQKQNNSSRRKVRDPEMNSVRPDHKFYKNLSDAHFEKSVEPGPLSTYFNRENSIFLDTGSSRPKGLTILEFNNIVNKVKRERKKIADEEKWNNFNCEVQKSQIQIRNPIDAEDEINCQNNTMDEESSYSDLPRDIDDGNSQVISNHKQESISNETVDKERQIDNVISKLTPILKKINILLLTSMSSMPREDKDGQLEKQATEFITQFKKNYILQHGQMDSKVLNKISKGTSALSISYKLTNLQTIFQAFQAIEEHLKRNHIFEPIKDILYSFFNYSYSLCVLYKHFNKKDCDDLDLENLLMETLNILHSKGTKKEIVGEIKVSETAPKEEDIPLWLKESVALARIKFGPPDKTRNVKTPLDNDLPPMDTIVPPMKEEDCSCSDVDYTIRSSMTEFNNCAKLPASSRNVPYDPKLLEENSGLRKNGIKECESGKSERKPVSEKAEVSTPRRGAESPAAEGTPLQQEPLSTIIAKKIQEIPGVDAELRKVEDIRIKMMSILLNIKVIISKNFDLSSLPLDEDFDRIQQRTIEFGARFKRNYAYRTKCQVIEKQLQILSVAGLTHEVFFVFYHYIYELTFMLKPFYGFTKTRVLDDVEKLVVDTSKLLKELKYEQEMAKVKKPSKVSENKQKTKQRKDVKFAKKDKFLSRRKSPYANKLIKKTSKQSVEKNDEKCVEENKDDKVLNFMMNIKQRRGAEIRIRERINYNVEEPKTMVEILAENEPVVIKTETTSQADPMDVFTLPEFLPVPNILELQSKPPEQPKKSEPGNVKLITMRRPDSKGDGLIMVIDKPNVRGSGTTNEDNMWGDLTKYKDEFTVYKASNSLYNRKSLQTVKSMTEKLMGEALSDSLNKVLNTINIQDLPALRNIMEEEIK